MSGNSARWKIILSAVLIFGSGVVLGAIGNGMFIRHRFHTIMAQGGMPYHFLVRMTDGLGLRREQRQAIDPIMYQAQKDLFNFRSEHHPEMQQIMDKAITGIRAQLDPEQQKKLDNHTERMKRRFEERVGHAPN